MPWSTKTKSVDMYMCCRSLEFWLLVYSLQQSGLTHMTQMKLWTLLPQTEQITCFFPESIYILHCYKADIWYKLSLLKAEMSGSL